jgi:solute carrier family 26 (sodium-independent sulfate anion transporter), member 11
VGVILYSVFATSKDITIGPTAVLSLLVGQSISNFNVGAGLTGAALVNAQITFAVTLSFFTGLFQVIVGMARLGIIIDLIPIPVIGGLIFLFPYIK